METRTPQLHKISDAWKSAGLVIQNKFRGKVCILVRQLTVSLPFTKLIIRIHKTMDGF